MQAKLPETNERFRLLVESVSGCGIFAIDRDGYVASWDEGARLTTGYTSAEVVGKHFSQFYTPEEVATSKPGEDLHSAELLEHVTEQGWRVKKDGTRFWAGIVISTIRDRHDKLIGFAHILRRAVVPLSISKRTSSPAPDSPLDVAKHGEKMDDEKRLLEMVQAKVVAERANKAKDEFLAVLSHELRTPLTPALAAASYLADHADNLPLEFQEEVATIRRNIELEARLIDDLLDLTRIVSGKIGLHFEVVDAHRFLRETIEVVSDDIFEKELDVRLTLSAPMHDVWADPVRLRQVFWNLVRNAVKFTPPRGHILVRTSNDEEGRFQLEVCDTGIGIEPEDQAELFNAFEQGSRSITRQFGGLGLGLTISKRILDLHGGTISVRSDGKDLGTTFTVVLKGLATSAVFDQPPVESVTGKGKNLRLLLVEDHADTRRTLSRLLTRCGHKVSSTDRVESALKLLESKRFDAVVSDIGLPDRSGYEFMIEAKQHHHELKGIALSGFGTEEDVRQSLAAGFDHHLTKPVDFRRLQSLLRELAV